MQIRRRRAGPRGRARRQGAGRGRDWRSRAYRSPGAGAKGEEGGRGRRPRGGGRPEVGGREPPAGAKEAAGRERDGAGEVCGPRAPWGGERDRARAVSARPPPSARRRATPSPLVLSVRRPGTSAGDHQGVPRRSQWHGIASCANTRGAAGRGQNRAGAAGEGPPRASTPRPAKLRAFRLAKKRRERAQRIEDRVPRLTGESVEKGRGGVRGAASRGPGAQEPSRRG